MFLKNNIIKKVLNIIFILCTFLVIIILLYIYKNENLDFNIAFYNSGIFFFGISIVFYGYFLFFIGSIIIYFLSKNKLKNIFIYALILYSILLFKNIFNYGFITAKGLNDFTFKSNELKIFYGYDDYITFTSKIRNYLGINYTKYKTKCNIYIFSNDNRLENYGKLVYLKPCKVINSIEKTDYIIYYNKEVPVSLINKIVLSYNDSYLVKFK